VILEVDHRRGHPVLILSVESLHPASSGKSAGGPTEIARTLKIRRASLYRVLEQIEVSAGR
jgi:hypothetical protein